MSRLKVKFTTPREVADFVNRVERYPYAMDLSRGSVVVDAKSLLGVLSLDLTRVLTVSMNGRDAEFESYLDELKIAA